MENGEAKEVKEHYITNCELFSEAEQKGLQEYADYNMECDVFAITRSKVIEIIGNKTDDNHFFRAIVTDVRTDDDGVEKELKYVMLVAAKDVTEANRMMLEHLKQGLGDFKLDGLVKTKILEVL